MRNITPASSRRPRTPQLAEDDFRGLTQPEAPPTHYMGPIDLELRGFLFVAFIEREVDSFEFRDDKLTYRMGLGRVLKGAIFEGSAQSNRDYMKSEMKVISSRAQPAGKLVMYMVP